MKITFEMRPLRLSRLAHLHDLKLSLDFIVVQIRHKLLLKCGHFRLQLSSFPLIPLRTFFVVFC